MLRNNLICAAVLLLNVVQLHAVEFRPKQIARDFVAASVLKDPKAQTQAQIQKSLLKKSIIVRVKKAATIDGPVWQVAVSDSKKISMLLPLEGDLNTYALALNPLLKKESISLNDVDEANLYLKKILNIYGIYQVNIQCARIVKETKFSCTIKESKPREYSGTIAFSADGLFL
jgi:hypothetical protein